jgi:hypothetical protein
MKKSVFVIYILISTVVLQACINKSDSKTPPLIPGEVKPYSPADIGLTGPDPSDNTAQAALPVISEGERKAIYNALMEMEQMGMMNEEFLQKSSKAAYDTMKFQPLSDSELDTKIDNEMNGITTPPKAVRSNAEILARESAEGDRFFARFTNDLPNLTNQQLIDTRKNLTVTLAMIRLQMDHNGPDGLPEEFYLMAKTKTINLRQKITEELIRRGVTSI